MKNKGLAKFHLAFIFLFCLILFGVPRTLLAQESQTAGTFFGEPVPKANYFFILKVVLTYSSPWGNIPQNREQLEQRVWDELLLSYEAHRRGITVTEKELEQKISDTLAAEGVSFQWREDPEAYARWTAEKIGGSVALFESHMRHLTQVKKLYDEVLNSINPVVTKDEVFQEFLNEQNSLSAELAEFDSLEDAKVFYDKVAADIGYWEQAAQADKQREPGQRRFRKPGFVTLEYLMAAWGFPKKAVYAMIEMEKGTIYPPEPIYKGFGVFKILDIRKADEALFPQRKQGYFEQLRFRKKYDGFKSWLKKLRDDAGVQRFMELPPELLL